MKTKQLAKNKIFLFSIAIMVFCSLPARDQRHIQNYGRSIVVERLSSDLSFKSWQLTGTESENTAFNVYCQPGSLPVVKIASEPIIPMSYFVDNKVNKYPVLAVLKMRKNISGQLFALSADSPLQQNLSVPLQISAQPETSGTMLSLSDTTLTNQRCVYSDEFKTPLDSNIWIPEIAPLPDSYVYTQNQKLVLDTKGGVTVWYNKPLSGNFSIEFDRRVIVGNGKNDRLSDLNCFWMASDLRNPNLFTRNGVLEKYDSLQLYYVGMGGNSNSTTRFRKYEGNGERTLLKEYKDALHLLIPNHTYHIKIVAKKGITSFWVDGVCYFTYNDPSPLRQGYFGFRSTWSHQEISRFSYTTDQ